MNSSVSQILREQYQIAAQPGKKVECPFCHKKKFSIKGDDSIGKCFHPRCGKIIKPKAGGGGACIPPKSTATVQSQGGCTLKAYAEEKKLPVEFLQNLGLMQMSYMGKPAIRIPYFDADGNEAAIRFRTALEKSTDRDNRFRWKRGTKPCLYGLWKLQEAQAKRFIVMVEGESDAQTLWYHKIPAIGLPGANSWQESWAEHLSGIEKIFIVVEPDAGGEAVCDWLEKSAIREKALLLELENAKDPSELHVARPEGFLAAWQRAIVMAKPWIELEKRQIEQKKLDAWSQCHELAQSANILDLLPEVLSEIGVVGEAKSMKLIYLAVTSRLLNKPVSITVKGPSSCGKSHIVANVLKLFPESAFYALSAMSERALAYSEEPLQHRMLVIYEAAGMQSEFASYLMRSLLSEGRVRYETVEKTQKGMQARMIEREGPTGLIVTTTAIKLHPENETRLLTIQVTDTPEHTRKVLLAIADECESKDKGDLSAWNALQEWLELAEHKVTIPYAKELANLIPPVAIRLRRDFSLLLSLIKSHAILHQAVRKRDENGNIIATLQDYAIIRDLVIDSMAEGVEVAVSHAVRETVDAVKGLIKSEGGSVTIKVLASILKLDRSSASRRVRLALDQGFLKNLEDRKGRVARLVIGDPMPDEMTILPTVEQLQRCMVAGETGGINSPPLPEYFDGSIHNGFESGVDPLPADVQDWPADLREAFNERAGIMEYDGGLERAMAEEWARTIIRNSYHSKCERKKH